MGTRIVINGCELNTFDMDVEPGAEYLVTVGKTASSVKVERVWDEPDDALIEENKKLRELLQDAWSILVLSGNDDVVAEVSRNGTTIRTIDAYEIKKAMKGLGLEVQPWKTW